jgi:hypothetical protein
MNKVYIREIFVDEGDHKAWSFCEPTHEDAQEVFFESREVECEQWAARRNPGLISFSEDGENQWTTISEIRVPTEHDKQQLLAAFAYLHDCYVDTDLLAVNTLVHMYQNPDKIIVNGY